MASAPKIVKAYKAKTKQRDMSLRAESAWACVTAAPPTIADSSWRIRKGRRYKLRLHYIYTSQDDKITSDALSRCQKNQKNPGPGPRDLSRQRHIFRSPGCAASGGQHCEPCVRWLAEERSLRLR